MTTTTAQLVCVDPRLARGQPGLPPDDPRHGTENGYGNRGCRGPLCREAHATHRRETVLERRKAKRVPDADGNLVMPGITHGTPSGYGNYRCECTPCRAAWSEDTASRK